MEQRQSISIFSIPIDCLSMGGVLEKIIEMMGSYRHDGRPRYVATVNVDFLVKAHSWIRTAPRHPELLTCLREADLITADGMPLIWLSRLMNCPIPERVTGSDLCPKLVKACAEAGKSIYFLGGRESVARKAVEQLKKDNPKLVVAGISSPKIRMEGERLLDQPEQDAAILEAINRTESDLLFISFGNPKQELWFRRVRDRLKVPVSVGIGGTLEFIAGTVPRAPLAWQLMGMEWLFRFWQEPQRLWKRYLLGGAKFAVMAAPLLLHHWIHRRTDSDLLNQEASRESISLPVWLGGVDRSEASKIQGELPLTIDCSKIDYMTHYELQTILSLLNRDHNGTPSIHFLNVSKALSRYLKVHRAWDLFQPRI